MKSGGDQIGKEEEVLTFFVRKGTLTKSFDSRGHRHGDSKVTVTSHRGSNSGNYQFVVLIATLDVGKSHTGPCADTTNK